MPLNHVHPQDGFPRTTVFPLYPPPMSAFFLDPGTFSTCSPIVSVTSSPFTLAYSIKEVHLRRSDESCNEQIARCIVKVLRCINLLYDTVFHNNDPCTKCHSLCLVMCYVDDRSTQVLMKLGNLDNASGLSALHPGWTAARPSGRPSGYARSHVP